MSETQIKLIMRAIITIFFLVPALVQIRWMARTDNTWAAVVHGAIASMLVVDAVIFHAILTDCH
jgi:hypothetical protein